MFSIVCEFFTIFKQKKCKKVKLKGQVKNTELGKKSVKHEILIEIFFKQAVWVFMWLITFMIIEYTFTTKLSSQKSLIEIPHLHLIKIFKTLNSRKTTHNLHKNSNMTLNALSLVPVFFPFENQLLFSFISTTYTFTLRAVSCVIDFTQLGHQKCFGTK